ncbi:hypothetical protein [Roseimicrobium sp. ORNL1]|uniref:hypothetical protein n=1 Tax=Roseimicrobium sp. ORNL1 TaxID=2711231 RepID=UPI0013E183B4|nr:hypothetical protein [Roseimicrobium sp. ORNL1]QIF02455.1 hypothetical protein G5S37_13275 [Roseimicrobium sp. ORNL1]
MKRELIIVWFLWLAGAVSAQDLSALFIRRQSNALGLADRYGYCTYWKDVGQSVLIDGHQVPLQLRFATAPDQQFGRLFGQGWWCPLLECCVIQRSETGLILYTPGGDRVDLLKTPGKPNQYASKNGRWLGEVQGGDFKVAFDSENEFEFKGGRISRFVTKGNTYRWIYKDDVPVALVADKERKTLLEVRYGANSLVNKIIAPGAEVDAEYTSFPIVGSLGGRATVVGLKHSLASLRSKGTDIIKLTYELESLGSFVVARGVENGAKNLLMEWSASEGLLKRDEFRAYQVSPQEGGVSRPKITAIWNDGRTEWYAYNEKTGVAERRLPDGTFNRLYYVLTPGLAQGKLRKSEMLDSNQVLESSCVSQRDSNGKLKRSVVSGKGCSEVTEYANGAAVKIVRDGKVIFDASTPSSFNVFSKFLQATQTSPPMTKAENSQVQQSKSTSLN